MESMQSLLTGGNDRLARCAQRVIDSLDDPDGVISAFQSFIAPPQVKDDNDEA
jgi:hypothetical protein